MLKSHVLNVGKGSCIIIEFPSPSNRLGMIDIDDSRTFSDEELESIAELTRTKEQYLDLVQRGYKALARQLVEKAYTIHLTDPIDYFTSSFPSKSLFRFILTHPDMDHMSGLNRLAQKIGFMNFWDTDNDKSISPDSWESSPYRKKDWEAYQALRESTESPKCIRPVRGSWESYWDEDQVHILSPGPDMVDLANSTGEYNHISYVLRISYAGRSVLCAGDASVKAQEDILENFSAADLKADVLLAPHHGSKTHFCEDFVEAISPDLIVVSVAVGTDYAYKQYAQFGQVLSTKWQGNIVVTIDGSGVRYSLQFDR